MKKKREIEYEACDFCDKDEHAYNSCLGCSKFACHKCQEEKGKKYTGGCFHSGYGDGFYCNDCLTKLTKDNDKLLVVYKKLRN